ncbi:MAG: asparagine synthase (glutamine-hydrolyzing) [Betaproteobacteria bacterium]|nr:asparagine synthase (glutamine-hydrolyzing) [Betaproteobacteria bacterium]
MCGIVGILNIGDRPAPQRGELETMITRLHHRGPDGTGFLLDGPVGLAHARLSIIDLAGGQQPIANEDETIWTVFNGEIFNYIELRHELLAQGHRFRTGSDTEVIVHLYEQHGERFVDFLNGQFAIALWDSRQQRLILARDRTGIRPLYYTEAAGRLVFGSEVKSIFAVREVPRVIDLTGLDEICTYWSTLESRTVFSQISSLPPGHMMTVSAGTISVRRYWDWEFPERGTGSNRDAGDYADELRELLVDAVRLQLRSDVPVGAYLSGGLDSSIITTIIRNFSDTPLRTFSLTFDDAEFDESAHQQEMVKYLGTEHTAVRCARTDIAAAFPKAVLHAESTMVRTAPAPLMLLSGHVRASGYKVVLTGEGADEVFGGYDLFKEAKIRRFMAAHPDSTLRPRLLEKLYPYLRNSPGGGHAFARTFFGDGLEHIDKPYFAHMPRWSTTQRISRFYSTEMRQQLAARDPCAAIESLMPVASRNWTPMAKDQYIEAHTLMSGYLLSSQGDRMAMANSIEGRFPFLDHRLIEFANRLPPKLKMRGLTEKYLLKKSMTGLLPDAVRLRTKQPYRAPDSASFFVDGKPVDYVADLFSAGSISSAGYFDATATGKLFEKCRAGKAIGFADNMAFVAVLSTMLLHEQFVRGAGVAPTVV